MKRIYIKTNGQTLKDVHIPLDGSSSIFTNGGWLEVPIENKWMDRQKVWRTHGDEWIDK